MKLTPAQVDTYEVQHFLAARVAKTYRLPLSFAEGLVREAKRMLYVTAVTGESVAPSSQVDLAWHEMMMFTKFYRKMCEDFGGGFIHHEPTPPDESLEDYIAEGPDLFDYAKGSTKVGETETYSLTKANYEKIIGEKPDPQYWP